MKRRRILGAGVAAVAIVAASLTMAGGATVTTTVTPGDSRVLTCSTSFDTTTVTPKQVTAHCAAAPATTTTTTKPPVTTTTVAPPTTTAPPVTTTTQPPAAGTRWFSASSSWNTKVPANAAYTDVPQIRDNNWWLNAADFGVPVVHTDTTSTVVTVNAPNSWGWPATALKLRIPASAAGATGTDGSLVIIDGTVAYDFWQFNRSGNTANPAAWAKSDIVNGTGWGIPSPFLAAGIHATGSSLLAGLIEGDELHTGINHALAISVRFDLGNAAHVGEAINSDGGSGPIPEGARFAIPPVTPMPASITSVMGQNLWKAMQQYGAFVIDTMGGNTSAGFWADTNVNGDDVAYLLGVNASWTSPELTAIGQAVRRIS